MGLNQCPGCGAPVSISDKVCSHCGNEVIISSFQSLDTFSAPILNKYVRTYERVNESDANIFIAKGLCYLKLKLYDKASNCFLDAIDQAMDNAKAYFYYAASILKGKKPFLNARTNIDMAEQYLLDAASMENNGIYYYFLAYIRYDHHYRKGYQGTPNYMYYLSKAKSLGISYTDIRNLFIMLGTQIPDPIKI